MGFEERAEGKLCLVKSNFFSKDEVGVEILKYKSRNVDIKVMVTKVKVSRN